MLTDEYRLYRSKRHRKLARIALDRIYEDITNRRDDWQWKPSHELCRAYETLCVEDLQPTGMSGLWGRRMSEARLRPVLAET